LEDKDAAGPQKIRLGIYWFFSPATNYYRVRYDMPWLEVGLVNKPGQVPNYDYCYLTPELVPEKSFLVNRKISIMKRYKNSGNVLLKMEGKKIPRNP
jgi:hypothetical protein